MPPFNFKKGKQNHEDQERLYQVQSDATLLIDVVRVIDHLADIVNCHWKFRLFSDYPRPQVHGYVVDDRDCERRRGGGAAADEDGKRLLAKVGAYDLHATPLAASQYLKARRRNPDNLLVGERRRTGSPRSCARLRPPLRESSRLPYCLPRSSRRFCEKLLPCAAPRL